MEKTKFSRFQKFIKLIESLCNKIPQPGILFMYLFVITAVLSLILSKFNVLVINPTTNSELYVKNFFSVDGLYWFLGKMISNFTSFPPLGLVLVMTAAVGLCEESGLIVPLLNEKMKHIFPALLPYCGHSRKYRFGHGSHCNSLSGRSSLSCGRKASCCWYDLRICRHRSRFYGKYYGRWNRRTSSGNNSTHCR